MKFKKAIGNLSKEVLAYNEAIETLTSVKRSASKVNMKLADKVELYRQYEQNIQRCYNELEKSLDVEIGLRFK